MSSPRRPAMAPPMFTSRVLVVQFILLYAAILPVHSHSVTLSPISPTPTQCETFTFHWTGGAPPFFVKLFQQGGQGQRSLGPVTDSSYEWNSDFPVGTRLQAKVSSLNSESKLTDTFIVQSGSVSICLGSTGTTSAAFNTTAPSTDPTVHISSSISSVIDPSPSPSHSTPSASTELAQLSASSSVQTNTNILSSTDSQTPATPSSQQPTPSSQIGGDSSGALTRHSAFSLPLTSMTTSWETRSSPLPPPSGPPSIFNPVASGFPQQSASPERSKRGHVAGIIIGCLAAALLAALALVLLRRRRGARKRSRITSMATLDTLAFTAATWSDLSTAEPGKPLGANKGVTEWNADLFARDSSRNHPNVQSSPFIPFAITQAQVKRGPRITSLSTIPEASAESSMPSPIESDESASTAPNLHSYPPLVPQTLPTSGRSLREHGYSPAVPLAVQVPVNPFRARLLAARSRGTWAGNNDLGDPDPFR